MSRNIARALSLAALSFGALSFGALAGAISPPNLGQALAAQQQLVADQPYDAEIHNDHGNLLVLAGRHEEAGEAYRRAIDLAPAVTLARYNLGVLLQQVGLFKQAQAEFQNLLEIEPEHARTHYQLGMLFQARKQRGRALEHYARAFAYDTELTFPSVNPHVIDNDLATEALLMSGTYSDAPTSEVPRLYGQPDRIADLMLGRDEKPEAAAADPETPVQAEYEAEEKGVGNAYFIEDDEDERTGRGDDSEDDSDGYEDDRRALTSEDLDAGSSIGQVQRPPRQPRRSSANRSTGRSSQGRGSLAPVQPGGRAGSSARPTNDGRSNSGRAESGRSDDGRASVTTTPQGRRAPRYRPASRGSTGRLELRLLPAEPSEQRSAVTATR